MALFISTPKYVFNENKQYILNGTLLRKFNFEWTL